MKWPVIRDVFVISLLSLISFQANTIISKLTELDRSLTSLGSDSTQQEELAASVRQIYDILDAAENLKPEYGIYKNNEVGQAMGQPVYRRVHSNEITRKELEDRLYNRKGAE